MAMLGEHERRLMQARRGRRIASNTGLPGQPMRSGAALRVIALAAVECAFDMADSEASRRGPGTPSGQEGNLKTSRGRVQ